METTSLHEWLRTVQPPLPEPFLDQLGSWEAERADIPSLVRLGAEELARSMMAEGPRRRAAYALLASDAFVTYACELAARAPDVEAELLGILQAVGARLP